ncbi:hypothetical protein M378DRAFT_166792 [Amanita muscaria Koide BX008]|uniref:Uncharacterized protein n=1 Tax=Amanita muscaria (strain Koide BX008) TaxID=946122 RepID=A0A0C2T4R6_AMAMK|nr:hypothetical protein M378DRAFT_166792 [Amanita muscaria Koide BX008]
MCPKCDEVFAEFHHPGVAFSFESNITAIRVVFVLFATTVTSIRTNSGLGRAKRRSKFSNEA